VEPCPMCAGALGWSQIGKIVYGAPDTKRGFFSYYNPSKSPIHPKTVITGGVLEEECREMMQTFFKKLRQ
ncbi:MAG: nucleoside deaminase, partial [Muribaculaceae bacterium]|nr:nucleoside deaminase [Muribaculaceae bacterium]